MHKYIPLGLFCAYTIKSLILGVNAYEVGLVVCLAGLAAFFELNVQNKKVKELENELGAVKLSIRNINDNLDSIKNNLGSLKITQQYKTGTMAR